jgi:hypothetical protein
MAKTGRKGYGKALVLILQNENYIQGNPEFGDFAIFHAASVIFHPQTGYAS